MSGVSDSGAGADRPTAGIMAWIISVCGWLACAGMCLALTIALEEWPYAYEMLFPAVLLLLFGNILIFLFITTRWGARIGKLLNSVVRVCVGEGLILAGLYALGRYCIGY